jgi:hypothetical protein
LWMPARRQATLSDWPTARARIRSRRGSCQPGRSAPTATQRAWLRSWQNRSGAALSIRCCTRAGLASPPGAFWKRCYPSVRDSRPARMRSGVRPQPPWLRPSELRLPANCVGTSGAGLRQEPSIRRPVTVQSPGRFLRLHPLTERS